MSSLYLIFVKYDNAFRGSTNREVLEFLHDSPRRNPFYKPFEDGNGRIGRILVEKALSQGAGHPTLIAASKFIEKHKKEYYKELEKCNQTLEAQHWVEFFAKVILQAQDDSMQLLHFLIKKSKMLTALSGKLNHRQEKALLRMFAEGPDGFAGGLNTSLSQRQPAQQLLAT